MKKAILVYDISMCPTSSGLDMERVVEIYENVNLVVYDSTEKANNLMFPRETPRLFGGQGEELKSIDLGATRMTKEEIEKLIGNEVK